VVKSVDTADLKSADSKKSCRFDSGLGHQSKISYDSMPYRGIVVKNNCDYLKFSKSLKPLNFFYDLRE
jgi:hypothetical protein